MGNCVSRQSRRGHTEDLASCRATSGGKKEEERLRYREKRSGALTRRQNGVIAGRGCREEVEVGYEEVTTRRALEVLTFANVFKLLKQEIFLSLVYGHNEGH